MRRLLHGAAWLLLLGVAAVTVSPIGFRPTTGLPADVERFVALAIVGAMFWLGYPRQRPLVVVLIVSAVTAFELLQQLIPGRHGHVRDALIKLTGAGVGFTLAIACALVRVWWIASAARIWQLRTLLDPGRPRLRLPPPPSA